MENIIDLYESFLIKDGELSCKGKRPTEYAAPSSIHSVVTDWAYGKLLKRTCYDISDGSILKATIDLTSLNYRIKVKLNACLKEWKKYTNDITISVNGEKVVEQSEVFLENVNLGWPSVYFNVDSRYFKSGKNIIEVFTKDTNKAGLLISQVRVILFPEFHALQQISMRKYCELTSDFGIAIYDEDHSFKSVDVTGCSFNESVYFGDFCVLNFTADKKEKLRGRAIFGNKEVDLLMPEIIDEGNGFLVGMDSDDHRHDDSEETDRILTYSVFSDMVNFIQFRPHRFRNYYKLSSEGTFKKRIKFLEMFGIKYGIAGSDDFFGELPKNSDKTFLGFHMHELYHFFNFTLENNEYFGGNDPDLNFKGLRQSQSFSESNRLYREYLRKKQAKISLQKGSTSIGAPSLLCVYEGEAGFDRITIEPVSNLNILTGAVRATSVKSWGAHIPTDWYYGVPVDVVKSNKFLLSLQYLYLNGAAYVYAENALYKTNAFVRFDFEDEHCSLNRTYLRRFYEYTSTHPRKGKLLADKAIVFGRNEFMMWLPNDRMGELEEKSWDQPVWGKWDNSYQKCWQAIKSWLPFSEKQSAAVTPLNTHLFSGTPYGNVDVVYADKELSRYKTIAFLGWNTMNPELFGKLKSYVENGGTLVISYCHFNTVDRNDCQFEFLDNQIIEEFTGVKTGAEYFPSTRVNFNDEYAYLIPESESVNCVKCIPVTAEIICCDKFNNGLIFKNNYGKGKVYFAAFKEYPVRDWAIETISHLLEIVGNEGDFICDNKNISFTVRELDKNRFLVSVLNMNCIPGNREFFNLKVFDKVISDVIRVTEIKNYEIEVV